MSFKEDLGKVVSCLTSPKAYSIYASVGVVVTALLSIRASKKNIEVAEELENKSKKELIKEAVKIYGPPALSTAVTVICITKIESSALKRIEVFADAYYAATDKANHFKNVAGAAVLADISSKFKTQEDIEAEHPDLVYFDNEDFEDDGKILTFYDDYSHRYFESTLYRVLLAEYHLNRNFSISGTASVNEFYDFLGVDTISYGDCAGWTIDELLEGYDAQFIDFRHKKVKNGDREGYVLYFEYPPSLGESDYAWYPYKR